MLRLTTARFDCPVSNPKDAQCRQIAPPTAEDEEMAGERILRQDLLRQGRQTIEALAHVRHAGREPNPGLRRNRDHDRTSTARSRATASPSKAPWTFRRCPPAKTISTRPRLPLSEGTTDGAIGTSPSRS